VNPYNDLLNKNIPFCNYIKNQITGHTSFPRVYILQKVSMSLGIYSYTLLFIVKETLILSNLVLQMVFYYYFYL